MDSCDIRVLRGPNIWARFPVLEIKVDLSSSADAVPTDSIGFRKRLSEFIGKLPKSPKPLNGKPIDGTCSFNSLEKESSQRNGASQERPEYSVSSTNGDVPHDPHTPVPPLINAFEETALLLQQVCGSEVTWGSIVKSVFPEVFRVIVQYDEEIVGRACVEAAWRICVSVLRNQTVNIQDEVAQLTSLAHDVCLGPSTKSIVRAAVARGIPFRRLNTDSMVQFGHGARMRRIVASETDDTGAIAEAIAQDKELTRKLLREVGVPVPVGRPVIDAEDARRAALEIGLPVVVKPRYGNQGRGVATNLTSLEQVTMAYTAAHDEGSSVVVEKHVPGDDYRLTVVGQRMIAASRRQPALVVGDGIHTVAELIEIVNQNPLRSNGHATALSTIKVDEIAAGVLSEQGIALESVPSAGRTVFIRRNANLSTGGTATDVTDDVHSEVAARAIEAARVVGLDVAGVDVLAADIGRPLEEQSGVIVEVNASPGLRMHIEPSHGKPRPVGEAIVDLLFPNFGNGRIPTVGITGTNGKTTTTRFIAHILKQSGRTVGMTCSDGIYIDGRLIERGDCSGPRSARSVLANPVVEAAVLETARGGILREGLGFDRCDVAVITNIGAGDHLGLNGVESREDLARVKRVLVDAVKQNGSAVLNADDPLVAAMALRNNCEVVYFSQRHDQQLIRTHLAQGGRAVFVDNGSIVLAKGHRHEQLIRLEDVPLTRRGRVRFQIENTLAAVAAGWSLGIPTETICNSLATFQSEMHQVPGRFNVLQANGSTIVLDFGHNPSALEALEDGLKIFPESQRVCVFSADGDRRDDVIIRQAEIVGGLCDKLILYEDPVRMRGRKPGEIFQLLRRGLTNASRVVSISEVQGEVPAIAECLGAARPGNLLLILHDDVPQSLTFVENYFKSHTRPDSKQSSANAPITASRPSLYLNTAQR